MKKMITLLMSTVLTAALVACGASGGGADSRSSGAVNESAENAKAQKPTDENGETQGVQEPSEQPDEVQTETAPNDSGAEQEAGGGKVLVVYFSATGNTEAVANTIAEMTGADRFELVPVNPYSDADLDWTDEGSRVVYEHDHPEDRDVELVETAVSDWDSYDTVFIGYPIWWHEAAWVVNPFVTENDFTGKRVIPFCTSSSSELGESGALLAEMAGTGDWQEGMRFRGSNNSGDVTAWLEELGY